MNFYGEKQFLSLPTDFNFLLIMTDWYLLQVNKFIFRAHTD